MNRVPPFLSLATALLCISLVTNIANANTSFDTTPNWNGSDFISPFGSSGTSTYGETFVTPADSVLNSFTFYIKPDTGVSLSLKGYVYQWSGSLLGGGNGAAFGNALYSSPDSIVVNNDSMFNAVTINTGGVSLSAGSQYVALLTLSNPSDYIKSNGDSIWGVLPYEHLPNSGGGGMVYDNNGSDFSAINNHVWDNWYDFGEFAWKANFTPATAVNVPEPGSLASLLGIGVVGISLVRRRKVK